VILPVLPWQLGESLSPPGLLSENYVVIQNAWTKSLMRRKSKEQGDLVPVSRLNREGREAPQNGTTDFPVRRDSRVVKRC